VRNVTRPGVAGYAISAVDVALWDLKAKLLGLPLYRLLGAVRDRVPVYGRGGFTPYDEGQLRDQLSGWASGQGIPRVKIKIGESWGADPARDLDRMRQSRVIVGGDVELFVDANRGYGRKQAIRIMHAAADLDVRWFEEPVSANTMNPKSPTSATRRRGTPVVADPGQQCHDRVKRWLRESLHLPQRAGLHIGPVAHAGIS
jgi:L-alanine-DL-glutamate epimerase-like enolase superfamily enzyme